MMSMLSGRPLSSPLGQYPPQLSAASRDRVKSVRAEKTISGSKVEEHETMPKVYHWLQGSLNMLPMISKVS